MTPVVTAAPELAALGGEIERYCASARPILQAGQGPEAVAEFDALGAELRYKRMLINRLELDFARDAAQLEAIFPGADATGNQSAVSWIRECCHMTVNAAITAVAVGSEVTAIPKSVVALVDGRIGMAHLGLMATTARDVKRGLQRSGQDATFDESELLRQAEKLSVGRFQTACRHVIHAVDRAAFLEGQLEGLALRTLTVKRCGEGIELTGWFDSEGAALIRTALEPLSRPAGQGDEREKEQRQADALIELCRAALDAGRIPSRGGRRPHLQVTATLETLMGLVGSPAGAMEQDLVAAETVQRFACDATITRVLLDAESMVIDVGRSQRVVPGATRTALNVRDKGCRWPGCERPPSYTQAHHVEYWVHNGKTDMVNLVLLCHRHHWMVHEGGWQFIRTPEDEVMVFPPEPGHPSTRQWWRHPHAQPVLA